MSPAATALIRAGPTTSVRPGLAGNVAKAAIAQVPEKERCTSGVLDEQIEVAAIVGLA